MRYDQLYLVTHYGSSSEAAHQTCDVQETRSEMQGINQGRGRAYKLRYHRYDHYDRYDYEYDNPSVAPFHICAAIQTLDTVVRDLASNPIIPLRRSTHRGLWSIPSRYTYMLHVPSKVRYSPYHQGEG